MSDPAPFDRVLLVGCGLIGGSLGLAIQAVWPETTVSVLDPAVCGGSTDGGELTGTFSPVRRRTSE